MRKTPALCPRKWKPPVESITDIKELRLQDFNISQLDAIEKHGVCQSQKENEAKRLKIGNNLSKKEEKSVAKQMAPEEQVPGTSIKSSYKQEIPKRRNSVAERLRAFSGSNLRDNVIFTEKDEMQNKSKSKTPENPSKQSSKNRNFYCDMN